MRGLKATMPGSSLTQNNRLNPYLADETYERLNDLRFKRKATKWQDFFAWAVPHLEKAFVADEKAKAAKAKAKASKGK